MPVLNLGVVAHVDAGKTTLTERLLHATGVTDHLGRVDHGDTTTDADAIERQRGITIRTAVATFTLPAPPGDDVTVNLVDTPGHSDFVAEVERALAVLDGAVLVVSAVEGVQPQTRVLVRVLESLRIPFVVLVNKIDRAGADPQAAVEALREALTGDAVALVAAHDVGSRTASVRWRDDPALDDELVDRLAPFDEDLLRQYVDGTQPPTRDQLLSALAERSRTGDVHPVLMGAALVGTGVDELLASLPRYLPVTPGRAADPLHASVFSIERDAAGHRVAYLRLHAGTLAARDHVVVHRRGPGGTTSEHEARVMEVATFDHAAVTVDRPARAGEIARVQGLADVAVGDQLGRWDPARGGRHFAAPGLESVVRARDDEQRIALFQALQQLSEQDPLIDARLDGLDHEVTVSLYGEVQKEVLAARLLADHGVVADFLPTRVVHVERVTGTGEGFDRTSLGNASLGLRLEPGTSGGGVSYRLGEGVERGYLLPSFHVAVEEQLAVELREGRCGWRLEEGLVVVTHARFSAPTPSAGEYRRLTTSAFRQALAAAGTVVCAPVSRFEVDLPSSALTAVLARLVALGATPVPTEVGLARSRVTGTIATEHVHDLEQRLPDLTGGLGSLWTEPAGHEPVVGDPPSRLSRP
ncbi:tetracycline resistance ribosomal protection protein Otr(A) [Angustibacter peucedani]